MRIRLPPGKTEYLAQSVLRSRRFTAKVVAQPLPHTRQLEFTPYLGYAGLPSQPSQGSSFLDILHCTEAQLGLNFSEILGI